MVVPALNAVSGQLPLGRHGATLADLQTQFVDAPALAASTTRRGVWNEFEQATAALRQILPVNWVWISGSFLSSKLDPSDIDVVYWCEDVNIDALSDPRDKFILEQFATNKLRNLGQRIDSRVCRWHVRPEPGLQRTAQHHTYAMERGFWDDFWLRKRSGTKGAPPVREDALPRRGYVEVFLDGAK